MRPNANLTDFYKLVESGDLSERRDALKILENAPELGDSDINQLIGVLRTVVASDTDIELVTSAAKCLLQVARRDAASFVPHAIDCYATLFARFKRTVEQSSKNNNNHTQVTNMASSIPPLKALNSNLASNSTFNAQQQPQPVHQAHAPPQQIRQPQPVSHQVLQPPQPLQQPQRKFQQPQPQQPPPPPPQRPTLQQQPIQPAFEANFADDDDEESAYNALDPVNIVIPARFYQEIESKKWSERRDALQLVEDATKEPRLHEADIDELVRTLRTIVAKDSNLVVAVAAAKCLFQLARGLRRSFGPHSACCIGVLLEKLKEKKPNAVSVIREALDAAFVGTTIENIQEIVITNLSNKNPSVKAETALFLARATAKYPEQASSKKVVKPLVDALLKTICDMDVTVRDSSAAALGTLLKVIGERSLLPMLGDVDPLKMDKIKDAAAQAQVKQRPTNGSNPARTANGLIRNLDPQLANQPDANNLAPFSQQPAGEEGFVDAEDDEESAYNALDPVNIVIPARFYQEIESKKWSERRDALQLVEDATKEPRLHEADMDELVRILRTLVAKDSNLVVVVAAAKCIFQLARGLRRSFGPHSASCIGVLLEKLKEKKPNVVSAIREALDAAFVGTTIEITQEIIVTNLSSKNPSVKAETALFLARMMAKYPEQFLSKKTVKPLVDALLKTICDMDVTVRDSSATALGTLMKVVGERSLVPMLGDVDPLKMAKIKEASEQAQVKRFTRPAPTNGPPPGATIIRSSATSKHTPPNVLSTKSATVKRTGTIIKQRVGDRPISKLPQPASKSTIPRSVATPPKPTLINRGMPVRKPRA